MLTYGFSTLTTYATVLSRQDMRVIERGSRRANGVHITYGVTNEIRNEIRRCLDILCCNSVADVTKFWPLRDQFRDILARAS